jgi:uncharacterized protein (DUF1684 family)
MSDLTTALTSGAMSELDEFRAEKDTFFREHPQSPLTPQQRSSFEGLRYFPENPDLVVRTELITEAVDLVERIVMQTTTGDEQVYRRAGVIEFDVEGERARLTLYASNDTRDLFLPFRDATSGKETYGAGRYLEVEPADADGRVVIDFNYAYSPSCAYNPNWSCPIPPGENWLAVPIRAGEKTFPGAHDVAVG